LDPAIRAGVKQVERENATIQHLVVEGADVELCTQFLPSAFAKFDELELPDLVTKSLGRPGNVAVCFGLDLGFVEGAGFAEEVDPCSRLQPLEWMPVSTTRRTARKRSLLSRPQSEASSKPPDVHFMPLKIKLARR